MFDIKRFANLGVILAVMASLINIIIPLETFYDEFEVLINKSGVHVYIEKQIGKRTVLKTVKKKEDLLLGPGEVYLAAYLTSVEFQKARDRDIFDDDFCVHAIEVLGGRATANELENLILRVISKTPDRNIKGFVNKLQQYLKKSHNYGIGVGSGGLYSKTFYNRSEILGKTLWFDFDRKFQPLSVD